MVGSKIQLFTPVGAKKYLRDKSKYFTEQQRKLNESPVSKVDAMIEKNLMNANQIQFRGLQGQNTASYTLQDRLNH